jgi:hypothetical protein
MRMLPRFSDFAPHLFPPGGVFGKDYDFFYLPPIEWFPSAADLRFAQIILSADAYRFDGSDLMPEICKPKFH